jgi:hypothetical protein
MRKLKNLNKITLLYYHPNKIQDWVTPRLAAGKHRSTTTLNYIVAHNFQTEIQRRKIKKDTLPHWV